MLLRPKIFFIFPRNSVVICIRRSSSQRVNKYKCALELNPINAEIKILGDISMSLKGVECTYKKTYTLHPFSVLHSEIKDKMCVTYVHV